jgi:membrane protease YdiL (CAAX protease family)
VKPARREAIALTLALLAYSNGLAAWAMRRGAAADGAFQWANPPFLLLVVLSLMRARREGLRATLSRAGYQRAGAGRAVASGLAVGALLAGPPLLFFARPLILDGPMEYEPIRRLTPRAFRRRVLLELSLGVALFEETIFRGLLFDAWRHVAPARTAHLITAATFAGWHLGVSVDTMRRTNIAATATRLPAPLRRRANALAALGGILSTAVAGLLFGAAREWGRGAIAGPALAHWIVDALMVAAIYRRGRAARADAPDAML